MNDKIIVIENLPFNLNEQESEELLKIVPTFISSMGKSNGYDNEDFKNNLFEYVIRNIFNFNSSEEYFESPVFKDFKEKGSILSNEILLGDVKKFKISFDITFYSDDMKETSNRGSFEMTSINQITVQKNCFFDLAVSTLKSGYILKKLEIVEIVEIK